jgi:hypothetical protein
MPPMSSLLPVLVVVVAGAAITAAALRRASAGLRWQGCRSQTAISPRAGRELEYLIGWPVLAAGFLLIGRFASDSVANTEHEWWIGAIWLAIPLALAFVPSAMDRSPPEEAP